MMGKTITNGFFILMPIENLKNIFRNLPKATRELGKASHNVVRTNGGTGLPILIIDCTGVKSTFRS